MWFFYSFFVVFVGFIYLFFYLVVSWVFGCVFLFIGGGVVFPVFLFCFDIVLFKHCSGRSFNCI